MSDARRTDLQVACLEALRPPDLRFELPLTHDLVVGCGLKQATAACCRYSHHPACPSAVVRSIVTVAYTARELEGQGPDRTTQLEPYRHEGDLLADQGQLLAVVRTQHGVIEATVEAWSERASDVICVDRIAVGVWCLTREEAETIAHDWEQLAPADEHLALAYLDPTDTEAYEALSERADFVPVVAYPPGATVLPGEVGHDHAARYVSEGVLDTPDPVDRRVVKHAQVRLWLADGTETEVGVRAVYTGANEEPLELVYETITPRGEPVG